MLWTTCGWALRPGCNAPQAGSPPPNAGHCCGRWRELTLQNAVGRIRLALGVHPGRHAYLPPDRLAPPTTVLTRAAEQCARRILPVPLLNHSYRTYVFGRALGETRRHRRRHRAAVRRCAAARHRPGEPDRRSRLHPHLFAAGTGGRRRGRALDRRHRHPADRHHDALHTRCHRGRRPGGLPALGRRRRRRRRVAFAGSCRRPRSPKRCASIRATASRTCSPRRSDKRRPGSPTVGRGCCSATARSPPQSGSPRSPNSPTIATARGGRPQPRTPPPFHQRESGPALLAS